MPLPASPLLPVLLFLGACGRAPAPAAPDVDIGSAAVAAQQSVDRYAAVNKASRLATVAPSGQQQAAADSAEGAADVVRDYYAMIAARRYKAAWTMWDQGGAASGVSRPAFARRFRGFAAYRATVGKPDAIDAGAGQRFVSVPVRIDARRSRGGPPVTLAGTVTLHRTGDIDGATAEQRRWHLQSVALTPSRPNRSRP